MRLGTDDTGTKDCSSPTTKMEEQGGNSAAIAATAAGGAGELQGLGEITMVWIPYLGLAVATKAGQGVKDRRCYRHPRWGGGLLSGEVGAWELGVTWYWYSRGQQQQQQQQQQYRQGVTTAVWQNRVGRLFLCCPL